MPSPSVFVCCKLSTTDWNSEDPGKRAENEVSPSCKKYDVPAWAFKVAGCYDKIINEQH